ncbi:MAG: YgiT-type zinc finger protein [Candidatus Heimdallarchaeota archaeon]|nr:YgiT-type zinc finger protein [Candidatus Heimdallarchaeota archaeon]
MILKMSESNLDSEKFEEQLEQAVRAGWLTEIQKEGLLAKKLDKKLTMQHRNALRVLRGVISNSFAKGKKVAYNYYRSILLREFITEVDEPRGVLCFECKKGTMIRGMKSRWYHHDDYDLILEQVPATICQNIDCRKALFSGETVEVREQISKLLQETLPAIQQLSPEPLEDNHCPLCSGRMESGQTGSIYRYRQALYHLRLWAIPLQGKCTRCGYQKVDEKHEPAINNLIEQLDELAFQLLETEP